MIHVTPAVSVSFFRPEFDNFLQATLGVGSNGMSLSVLSALARLDVDPWAEAAELAELPSDTARLKFAALIARLPEGSWKPGGSSANSARLIELLPRRRGADASEIAQLEGWIAVVSTPRARLLLTAVMVAAAIIFAYRL